MSGLMRRYGKAAVRLIKGTMKALTALQAQSWNSDPSPMTALTEHDEPRDAIAPSKVINSHDAIDLAERIESIKAGVVGALTAGLAFSATQYIHRVWFASNLVDSVPLPAGVNGMWLANAFLRDGIPVVIAALSGFLFGITYRYVIRQDRNLHLRSGAVLAFGLVRGLAQIDERLHTPTSLLALGWLGIESLLLFACARIALDWALSQGWVRPFGMLATKQVTEQRPHAS